ncbi:MAG: EAL domain-containing protein, partial [Acutalibacteraceae bacterium]
TMFSCLSYAYNISKEKGNGNFNVFEDVFDENRKNLMELINTIRKSIENKCSGFLLHYQPIVDAETQRLRGAEALVRWENEEYGLVMPNKFIPIIENDSEFIELGEWILLKAMLDMKPLLKEHPDFLLNVNLSYKQLQQDSFASMVRKNLKLADYPPENLCLEITERCRIIDIDRFSRIISDLRAIGVSFAIDDFGTGYSSMNILNQMKCDYIKIDKVFVDDVTEESINAKVIRTLSDLSGIYNSKVCVEGVETKEQYEVLKKCKVDSMQGYYFSRPVDLQKFNSLFK